MKKVSPPVRLVAMTLCTAGILFLLLGIKNKPDAQEIVSMLNREVGEHIVQGVRFTYQLEFTEIKNDYAHTKWKMIWHNVDSRKKQLFADGIKAYHARVKELLTPFALTLESGYTRTAMSYNKEDNIIIMDGILYLGPLH